MDNANAVDRDARVFIQLDEKAQTIGGRYACQMWRRLFAHEFPDGLWINPRLADDVRTALAWGNKFDVYGGGSTVLEWLVNDLFASHLGIDLAGADWSGVDFSGALIEAIELDGVNLTGATYDWKTKFIGGFIPEAAGMVRVGNPGATFDELDYNAQQIVINKFYEWRMESFADDELDYHAHELAEAMEPLGLAIHPVYVTFSYNYDGWECVFKGRIDNARDFLNRVSRKDPDEFISEDVVDGARLIREQYDGLLRSMARRDVPTTLYIKRVTPNCVERMDIESEMCSFLWYEPLTDRISYLCDQATKFHDEMLQLVNLIAGNAANEVHKTQEFYASSDYARGEAREFGYYFDEDGEIIHQD